MEIKDFLLLGILILLFFNTFLISNDSGAAIAIALQQWEIDDNTSFLQPVEFDLNTTVRVFDLIVASPGSIIIGDIINGTPFSRISAQLINPISNLSRIVGNYNRDWNVLSNRNGTTFVSSQNFEGGVNSSSALLASNEVGNAIFMQKFSNGHTNPNLGNIINRGGDLQLLVKKNNSGFVTFMNMSPMNDSNNTNTFEIGFYDSVITNPSFDVLGRTGVNILINITTTSITNKKKTFFDDTLYINQTYTNTNPKTSPDDLTEKIALFARDDNNLYIKRSNGQIKRVSVVGSGSSVFSEEVKFNNHTSFYGNVFFNNSIYNGASHGILCVDGRGQLYKSSSTTQCSGNFVNATIANPTLGDE